MNWLIMLLSSLSYSSHCLRRDITLGLSKRVCSIVVHGIVILKLIAILTMSETDLLGGVA